MSRGLLGSPSSHFFKGHHFLTSNCIGSLCLLLYFIWMESIQWILCCIWFLLLNIMFLRCSLILACKGRLLLLHIISRCEYTTTYLSVDDFWLVSCCGPLWAALCKAIPCISLGCLYTLLLSICLGVNSLGQRICICSVFVNTASFPKWVFQC